MMNKYLSVWALAARATVYKVLLITLAAAAAAGTLVYTLPIRYEDRGILQGDGSFGISVRSLESVPAVSLATVICGVGFLALMVVLSLQGCGFGAKTGYTVRRLRVRQRSVNLLWAGHNVLCVLFYWGVMALTLYLAMTLRADAYAADADASHLIGPQALLLAFYGSAFLHHLLPLADTAVWVENIALVAACGFGTAAFSHCQRQRGVFASFAMVIPPLALTALSFTGGMGSNLNFFLLAAALTVSGFLLWRLLTEDGEDTAAPPAPSGVPAVQEPTPGGDGHEA